MQGSIVAIVKLSILVSFFILTIPSTAFAAWSDISSSVTITQTNRAIDRVKRSMFSYVTIENTSNQDITAPLRLAIQDSTIPVTSASGTTENNSPYLTITETSIPANSKITYRVDFSLSRRALSFTPTLEQEEVISEFTPPVFRSFEFVELRGRDGHQGYFPVYGKPTFGNGVVDVKIEGDVKDLSVTVKTATSTETFKFNPENIDPEKGYTRYFVDVTIPKEDFSLDIVITAPDGEIINKRTNTRAPKDFSVTLAKSDHFFSRGKNSLTVIVTNKGNTANFEAIVEDSEGIIQGKGYFPQTFTIEKDGEADIGIPIDIVSNSDISNLTFTIKISNLDANTSEVITYDVLVDSDEEKLSISSKEHKWRAIPGSCEPVGRNDLTFKLIIIGSSAVNVGNIDINNIEFYGGQKPTRVEVLDILSSNDSCSSPIPDGVNDLVLTFDLQKILEWEISEYGSIENEIGRSFGFKLINGYIRGFDVFILVGDQ